MASLKNSRLKLSPAFWLFAITFAIRIFALIRLSNSPYFAPNGGDMKFYNDWALRILHGQFTDGRAFYGLPGYAYLLALIYKCIGFDPFSIGGLQAIAESATAVFIWKIARRVFAGGSIETRHASLIGIVAALGWAFFQPAQTFSIILMPTSWMIVAFWFCVWQIVKERQTSLWRPWLPLGLLIGFVANIVATILFLIPLLIAAAFFTFRTEKTPWLRFAKPLASIALALVAIFAGTAPCWIHNYFIAREPVLLSAHSGINFYIGNNAIANGYPKIPPGMRAGQEGMLKDSITMAEVAAGRHLQRVEVSRYWSAKAHDYIRGHFGEWLGLMGVKLRNFWNTYQYDDLSLVTLFAQSGILVPGLRFGIVAALGLSGLIMAVVQKPRARWIAAAILLHMCALMPVFVTERYRLAAVPGLLMMMSYGLWLFWQTLQTRSWAQCATYVVLTAGTTVFVSWPQTDPGLWALDYYNTGVKETEAKNYDASRKDLEMAYAYVPENSEINFALGNVWLEQGDRTRAKQFYRQAVEINARHSSAYNNLGVLAMQEERWKLAETFLSRSVLIEPDDAKTHYLLAQTRLNTGNVAGARTEIDAALKINPRQPEFIALASQVTDRSH